MVFCPETSTLARTTRLATSICPFARRTRLSSTPTVSSLCCSTNASLMKELDAPLSMRKFAKQPLTRPKITKIAFELPQHDNWQSKPFPSDGPADGAHSLLRPSGTISFLTDLKVETTDRAEGVSGRSDWPLSPVELFFFCLSIAAWDNRASSDQVHRKNDRNPAAYRSD